MVWRSSGGSFDLEKGWRMRFNGASCSVWMSFEGREVYVVIDILNNDEHKSERLKSTKREFVQRDKMNYMG